MRDEIEKLFLPLLSRCTSGRSDLKPVQNKWNSMRIHETDLSTNMNDC